MLQGDIQVVLDVAGHLDAQGSLHNSTSGAKGIQTLLPCLGVFCYEQVKIILLQNCQHFTASLLMDTLYGQSLLQEQPKAIYKSCLRSIPC